MTLPGKEKVKDTALAKLIGTLTSQESDAKEDKLSSILKLK